MTAAPLRLGIAGLGTVGVGVVKMIQKNAALIEKRTGREITVSAVCANRAVKTAGSIFQAMLGKMTQSFWPKGTMSMSL